MSALNRVAPFTPRSIFRRRLSSCGMNDLLSSNVCLKRLILAATVACNAWTASNCCRCSCCYSYCYSCRDSSCLSTRCCCCCCCNMSVNACKFTVVSGRVAVSSCRNLRDVGSLAIFISTLNSHF